MKNYHIIKVENVWCNRSQMPKVKISSERFKQSIRVYYSNEIASGAPSVETALNYLEPKGFKFIGKGEGKDHFYLISETFEPIK